MTPPKALLLPTNLEVLPVYHQMVGSPLLRTKVLTHVIDVYPRLRRCTNVQLDSIQARCYQLCFAEPLYLEPATDFGVPVFGLCSAMRIVALLGTIDAMWWNTGGTPLRELALRGITIRRRAWSIPSQRKHKK